ncbi:transposase [Rhodopirellula bahusiensis]|uniref:transposase n=1 Tax=Rhodopirellula bahusiensis TaxID=2014065 RepID=UPI0032968653
MPRQKRLDVAGGIYHALNRGNAKQKIFHKPEDYAAFERVLGQGLERYEVQIYSYVLMPNHWHLVLRPDRDGQMGKMLRWVTATHTQRYHAHYHTAGEGHLYQSRFKSFPIKDDEHFLTVCRYVERNPVRANLVKRAELWQHGSFHRWANHSDRDPKLLSAWPIRRTANWSKRVNQALSEKEIGMIRTSVQRGRPFGDIDWVEKLADKHDLWSTLRSRGRPKSTKPT